MTELRAIQRNNHLSNYPDVLKADHVSKILGVSKWQVYEMWKRGELPCFRIGRLVRMRKEWLIDWMESQPFTSNANATRVETLRITNM